MPPATDPVLPALPPGNEEVRRRLVGLSRAGRLHHCLLFEGPSGVGKRASATWLAMLVNCQGDSGGGLFGASEPRSTPCGSCWSCRQVLKGEHPDVIVVGLDPEKATPIISVAQARELLSKLVLRPFNAEQRFVIIEPADALTAEAANALLKTFEEPPSQTGFILITERSSSLLATVRSRCQRIRFGPVDAGRVERWLSEQGVAEPELLARLSDGRPGRAQQLAEGELDALVEAREDLLQALAAPAAERQKWAETLGRGDRGDVRQRIDRLLEVLERLGRDCLLVLRDGPPRLALYNADRPELVADWSRALGVSGVAAVEACLAEAQADLAANVPARLVAETLLARVRRELGMTP